MGTGVASAAAGAWAITAADATALPNGSVVRGMVMSARASRADFSAGAASAACSSRCGVAGAPCLGPPGSAPATVPALAWAALFSGEVDSRAAGAGAAGPSLAWLDSCGVFPPACGRSTGRRVGACFGVGFGAPVRLPVSASAALSNLSEPPDSSGPAATFDSAELPAPVGPPGAVAPARPVTLAAEAASGRPGWLTSAATSADAAPSSASRLGTAAAAISSVPRFSATGAAISSAPRFGAATSSVLRFGATSAASLTGAASIASWSAAAGATGSRGGGASATTTGGAAGGGSGVGCAAFVSAGITATAASSGKTVVLSVLAFAALSSLATFSSPTAM